MAETDLLYTFNGIDPTTGEYLVPPLPAASVARAARGEPLNKEHLQELSARAKEKEKHYGVKQGVDPRQLAQTGWGVIFPADADAIREALQPLLDLRRSQAGDRYREYTGKDAYQPGMTSLDFLTSHDAGPGPADPERVPYYLLIVGDPEVIPFDFQYQLDVQYAVGRICFDMIEEYAWYARSVALAESPEHAMSRRVVLFGPSNPNDISTRLSAEQLIAPLSDYFGRQQAANWRFDTYSGEEATKARLASLLAGDSAPALLFTASHGLGFPNGHTGQRDGNGALLCQDWPGKGPAETDHYFAGADVAGDSNLLGMIAFQFACFGAGTPQVADFPDKRTGERGPIAPYSFVARLPQRMLARPKGGALAVAGHIDRAFACSFRWDGANSPQIEVFRSTLSHMMDGYPVGAALEFFNMRYAEMATLLSQRLDDLRKFKKVEDHMLAGLWTAHNDARNFILMGDPAARLRFAAEPEKEKRLSMSISAVAEVRTPVEAAPEQPPKATEADFLLGFGSGSETKATIQSILERIGNALAKTYEGLATVEVTTYISDGVTEVSYQNGQFVGAKARAISRISLDGNAQACVPLTAGKIDEALWKLHSDMLDKAMAHRIEILKLAFGMASGLFGGGIKLP